MDTRVGCADPAWPSRLQPAAALRSLPGCVTDCPSSLGKGGVACDRPLDRRVPPKPNPGQKENPDKPDDASASSSSWSKKRSRPSRADSGRRCTTSRSWSKTSHRPTCARRSRSSRPTRSARALSRHAADRAPLGLRQHAAGSNHALPGPIEDASEDEDDVRGAIGETLIHEFGHYFGLTEERRRLKRSIEESILARRMNCRRDDED